jgi:hypothetical protein
MQKLGVHLNNLTGTMPPSLGNMLNATLLCVRSSGARVTRDRCLRCFCCACMLVRALP